MRWSDATARPSDRKLREFAGTAVIILAVLTVWRLLTPGGLALAACYATAAVVVGAVGVAKPRWLTPVFMLWMIVAFPIAWAVSHLLLAVIYFGLITPLGLVFRVVGRDVLDVARPGRQDSHWREKPAADKPERYLQQF